jgi:hypothetical protein
LVFPANHAQRNSDRSMKSPKPDADHGQDLRKMVRSKDIGVIEKWKSYGKTTALWAQGKFQGMGVWSAYCVNADRPWAIHPIWQGLPYTVHVQSTWKEGAKMRRVLLGWWTWSLQIIQSSIPVSLEPASPPSRWRFLRWRAACSKGWAIKE